MPKSGLQITIAELDLLKKRITDLQAKKQFKLTIKLGKSYSRLEEFTGKLREVHGMLKDLEKEDVSVSVAKNVKTAFASMQKSISSILTDTKTLTKQLNEVKNAAAKVRDDVAKAGQPKEEKGQTASSASGSGEIEKRNLAAQKYAKTLSTVFDAQQRSAKASKTWSQYLKGVYKVTQSVTTSTDTLGTKTRIFFKILNSSSAFRPANKALKTFAGGLNKITLGFSNLIYWQARWYATRNVLGFMSRTVSEGVGAFIEFDQELKNIQSIAGATEAQLKSLEGTMRNVASSTRFSIVELSKATTTLVQSGLSIVEAQAALPAVANLATATMTDMNTTTNLITSTMRAFNVELNEVAHTADIFANAVSKSKLTIDKIGVAFNYVGPVAQQVGLSLEDTAATLGLLANKGIQASTIGTSLRTLFGALLAPTEKFKKAIAQAGLSVSDLNPRIHDFGQIMRTLKKSGLDITQVFQGLDRRAAGALASLIDSGADSFERMRDAMGESGAAARKAEIQLTGISQIIKNLKDNVQLLTTAVIDSAIGQNFAKVLDIVRKRVVLLNDLTREFPEQFSNTISRALEKAGVILLTGMSALGALAGTKLIISLVATVKTVLAAVGFKGLLLTAAGGPIVAGVAALGGLAALAFGKHFSSKIKNSISDRLKKDKAFELGKEINNNISKSLQLDQFRSEILTVYEDLDANNITVAQANERISKIYKTHGKLLESNREELGAISKIPISSDSTLLKENLTVISTESAKYLANLKDINAQKKLEQTVGQGTRITEEFGIQPALDAVEALNKSFSDFGRGENINPLLTQLAAVDEQLARAKDLGISVEVEIDKQRYDDVDEIKDVITDRILKTLEPGNVEIEMPQVSIVYDKSKILRSRESALTILKVGTELQEQFLREFDTSFRAAPSLDVSDGVVKLAERYLNANLPAFKEKIQKTEAFKALGETQQQTVLDALTGEADYKKLTEVGGLQPLLDALLNRQKQNMEDYGGKIKDELIRTAMQAKVGVDAAMAVITGVFDPISLKHTALDGITQLNEISKAGDLLVNSIAKLEEQIELKNKAIENAAPAIKAGLVAEVNVLKDQLADAEAEQKFFIKAAKAYETNMTAYAKLRLKLRSEITKLTKAESKGTEAVGTVAIKVANAFFGLSDAMDEVADRTDLQDNLANINSLLEQEAVLNTLGAEKVRAHQKELTRLAKSGSYEEIQAHMRSLGLELEDFGLAALNARIDLEIIGGDQVLALLGKTGRALYNLKDAGDTGKEAFKRISDKVKELTQDVKNWGIGLKTALNIQKEVNAAVGQFQATNDFSQLMSELQKQLEGRNELELDITIDREELKKNEALLARTIQSRYELENSLREKLTKNLKGDYKTDAERNAAIEKTIAARTASMRKTENQLTANNKKQNEAILLQEKELGYRQRNLEVLRAQERTIDSLFTIDEQRALLEERAGIKVEAIFQRRLELTKELREASLQIDQPLPLSTTASNVKHRETKNALEEIGMQIDHNISKIDIYNKRTNAANTDYQNQLEEIRRLEVFRAQQKVYIDSLGEGAQKEAAIRALAQIDTNIKLARQEATAALARKKANQEAVEGLRSSNIELGEQETSLLGVIKRLKEMDNIWEGPKQGLKDFILSVRTLGDVLKDVTTNSLSGLASTTSGVLNDILFGIREHNTVVKQERDRAVEEQLQDHDREYYALQQKLLLEEIDQQQYHTALVEINANSAKERAKIEEKYENEKKGYWESSKKAFGDFARSLVETSLKMIHEMIAQRLILIAINAIAGIGATSSAAPDKIPGLPGAGINASGVAFGFAEGGEVPSTPTSIPGVDSVPVLTMPGEYIVKKSSVDKYGPGFMDRLNTGTLDPRKLPKFASGGMVRAPGQTTTAPTRDSEERMVTIYNFIDPSSLPQQPTSEDIVNVISMDALQNGPGIQTIRQRLRG